MHQTPTKSKSLDQISVFFRFLGVILMIFRLFQAFLSPLIKFQVFSGFSGPVATLNKEQVFIDFMLWLTKWFPAQIFKQKEETNDKQQ